MKQQKFYSIGFTLVFCLATQLSHAVQRIDLSPNNEPSNGVPSYITNGVSLSRDGRYIVFNSDATNLTEIPTNGIKHVFVHDLQSGRTKLVSKSSSGEQGNSTSNESTISGNGKEILFLSAATNLVNGDINNKKDLFVYNIETEATERVNVDALFLQEPMINSDGTKIAFSSALSTLVSGDNNRSGDVFLHDRTTGITKRASVSSNGTEGFGRSKAVSISGNGRFVAFETQANPRFAIPNYGHASIFVHDIETGITQPANGSDRLVDSHASWVPTISQNGRYVTYRSTSTEPINNNIYGSGNNIFVHDLQTNLTELVSISSWGIQSVGAIDGKPSISSDGRYVIFATSRGYNLVPREEFISADPDYGYFCRLYIHDRVNAQTKLVETIINREPVGPACSTDAGSSMISGDGNTIVFQSYQGIYVTDNPFKRQINLVGEPQIDRYSESGIYIWHDQIGRTHLKAVAGDENGELTRFSGSLIAEQSIDSLRPGSLETQYINSADVLKQVNSNRVDFKLFVRAPYYDDFSVIASSTQSLCLILSEYKGGLFLGPDKVNVVPAYDINKLLSCDESTLPVEGEPIIDSSIDEGWYIWKRNGTWYNKIISRADSVNFQGGLHSIQALRSIDATTLEARDTISDYTDYYSNGYSTGDFHNPFNFEVSKADEDGFNFIETENSETCAYLTLPEKINIFLGPNKIPMGRNLNLTTLNRCPHIELSNNQSGPPQLDQATEEGAFIWKENDTWFVRFVAGGSKTSYSGYVSSADQIIQLQPIGLESPDELINNGSSKVSYELLVTGPYRDDFSFVQQTGADVCFELSSPNDSSLYLGANKIPIPASFNLNTFAQCDSQIDTINVKGKPVINRATDAGIFIWKNYANNWIAEVVSGDVRRFVDISVNSTQSLSKVIPVSIESSDVFTVSPNNIDMSLSVDAPWMDGFKFTTQNQASTCVSTTNSDVLIYLGPDRVNIGSSVDLNTLAVCR